MAIDQSTGQYVCSVCQEEMSGILSFPEGRKDGAQRHFPAGGKRARKNSFSCQMHRVEWIKYTAIKPLLSGFTCTYNLNWALSVGADKVSLTGQCLTTL